MSRIKTFTGHHIDPLHPDPGAVDIRDIAHALSMLCRANGHFKTFYSVGQHCINCMREAAARGHSPRVQLATLLHDASEAYLCDLTRPVKRAIPAYMAIEKPLQEVIWGKWLTPPLTEEERHQVQGVDDDMLYHELASYMNEIILEEPPAMAAELRFYTEGFSEVEETYLGHFRRLMEELAPR